MQMEELRYPIGKFKVDGTINTVQREKWIEEIGVLPFKLKEAVKGLTNQQLNAPYRPDGWTVIQVIHHVADSHMNSFIRYKLALTEDNPTIKPYDEGKWAELADGQLPDIEISLKLLEFLHQRWVVLLRSIDKKGFERTYVHPESGTATLEESLGLYAWHGMHHTAHITSLRERMNW